MLLPALSNFLAGKEGSIIHLVHEPQTGKNQFMAKIITLVCQICPDMRFFYCDTQQYFPAKLLTPNGHQIFHSPTRDSQSLTKILLPMESSTIFANQVVIIDCLTDLFRDERGESFSEYRLATATFATDILNKINLISLKNRVHFLLIHTTSYRPQLNCQLAVEQELMTIAQGIWVTLSKSVAGESEGTFQYHYNAHLSYQYQNRGVQKDFPYRLQPRFEILPVVSQINSEDSDE